MKYIIAIAFLLLFCILYTLMATIMIMMELSRVGISNQSLVILMILLIAFFIITIFRSILI
jgi:hypothetical protein|uniref:Uncharacterized protein n=1 Tax=Myoviridae sp. ctYA416 TaxID=2825125 RepID=A0A8S5UTN8_9CAUD|nr:MAG TPA: hypothetical protein [Myoviridae sp. ctYA416]